MMKEMVVVMMMVMIMFMKLSFNLLGFLSALKKSRGRVHVFVHTSTSLPEFLSNASSLGGSVLCI